MSEKGAIKSQQNRQRFKDDYDIMYEMMLIFKLKVIMICLHHVLKTERGDLQ